MFDKNIDPDSYEYESSDNLRSWTNMMSEFFSKTESDIWSDKSNHTNHQCRIPDIIRSSSKWYSYSKSIDTGCNSKSYEWFEWEYIFLLSELLIFSLPSFNNHIDSDSSEKQECNPVIITRYDARKEWSKIESDNWHQGLKKSKGKSHRSCFFCSDFFVRNPCSNCHSEGISREWESKKKYSDKWHSILREVFLIFRSI